MTPSDSSESPNENTYVIDSESATEMARLLDQSVVGIEAMGGLFPELDESQLKDVARVLDVACGPGGWVHGVARAYPTMEVVGIDISKKMTEYARAHAQVRNLQNAEFSVMNAMKPLEFPDESFDLVNVAGATGFVSPTTYPQLIQRCSRVLIPGGILRLSEAEWGSSNKLAFDALSALGLKVLQQTGRSFSPTGRTLGITAVMQRLLLDAGYRNIRQKAFPLDFSYGTRAHELMCQDYVMMFKLAESFLLKTGEMSKQAFDTLYEDAMAEMRAEDFCAIWFLLTATGEKA